MNNFNKLAQMEIGLSQGKVAIIDPEDVHLVAGHTWHALKPRHTWYARNVDGVYMHRLLMNAKEGETVDHEDGDGLNNRRSTNLRIANHSEQQRNTPAKRKRAARSSQYKGVSWHVTRKTTKKGPQEYGRWRTEIELSGRKRIIRYAATEDDAARLYNELATAHFGAFAKLNIIVALAA